MIFPAQTQSLKEMFTLEEILDEVERRVDRSMLDLSDATPQKAMAIAHDLGGFCLSALACARVLLSERQDRELADIQDLRDAFNRCGLDLDALVDAKERNDIPRALALIREARERRHGKSDNTN